MRHNSISIRAGRMLAVSVLLAVGCAQGDAPSAREDVGVARSASAKKPKKPKKHKKHGKGASEHDHENANDFPCDSGPVPPERGMDTREPAPATPPRDIPRTACTNLLPGPRTLVLYDDTGPWSWLGELYAVAAGNLASHFGPWAGLPVAQYQVGDMLGFEAVIYVGSTYDQPLPVAFLDDVLSGQKPVVWMYDNIWQLANRAPSFESTYGYNPWFFDMSEVGEIQYKGRSLSRYVPNGGGIMSYSVVDTTKATVLADAVRADGTTFPWAIRSGSLTYIGEIPFAYIKESDRYLAFSDMLFDVLAPATQERHRALVRIEDVSANDDPAELTAIADYLASEGVPFSVATIPVYRDPLGAYNNGVSETVAISDAPDVADAIQHMVDSGGTLVLHGYTHQYEQTINPYTGVSADDFEFWMAHVDAASFVVYDGPVPDDSAAWATSHIEAGLHLLNSAGLPKPEIFEYPHYAGSAQDSRAIREKIHTAYHRGLYFTGALGGAPDDHTHMLGQFFPYGVRDTYCWDIIPETLGSYEPVGYNNNPPRFPADILAAAHAQWVVRDGVASFYFHPFQPLSALQDIISGLKAAGYTFIAPGEL